ncbi:hypothetical protein PWT90_09530 [Aphanocladium album]|nr:hypothetical protein PWT90_09530 [Aphanocladium album]
MADVAMTEVNRTAPSVSPPAETVTSSAEAPFPGPDESMTGANVTQRAPSETARMSTPLSDGPDGSSAHLIRSEQPERTALPSGLNKLKPRKSLGGVQGVLIGHWRDSRVPELENKHAVIGYLDVYDRLRTRIRPFNKDGETLSDYPLPSGPGGCWVAFDRIYFLDHLVGLDQFQVKEYVKLRVDASEETEGERLAGEAESVKMACINGRKVLQTENPTAAPLIARGAIPADASSAEASHSKRRRTSSSFVAIAPQDDAAAKTAATASQHPIVHDPLHGTRPTRIVIGYWLGSTEKLPQDRPAVWGIIAQNDKFRFKVVRETRNGDKINGNFPSGPGGIWIHSNDIEFDTHIKELSRLEIKEYCRIRQYQVDHGETAGERRANELRAVDAARIRATACLPMRRNAGGSNSGAVAADSPNGECASVGREPRRKRRCAASNGDVCNSPKSYGENEAAATNGAPRMQSGVALERANALVRREIGRVEAAQDRADRQVVYHEKAVLAADAGSVTVPGQLITNGRGARLPFHETEDIERLNCVWARQESLRLRAGLEDTKIYDGIEYERKLTGPFMGKLVSQGTIITIQGEDYVEYRVLTKPSFF